MALVQPYPERRPRHLQDIPQGGLGKFDRVNQVEKGTRNGPALVGNVSMAGTGFFVAGFECWVLVPGASVCVCKAGGLFTVVF